MIAHRSSAASRRTWGPFTGRQLTTIVCVVAVVALFPVGAWALSFSNVAITDPGGVNQAKVNANGTLEVGDATGPLTIDGTVRSAPPTKPIVILPHIPGGSRQVLYGPVSKSFAIGSLTLYNTCASPGILTLYSNTTPGSSDGLAQIAVINVPIDGVHVTYPIPLVTTPPANGNVTLEDTGSCVEITGVGYQT